MAHQVFIEKRHSLRTNTCHPPMMTRTVNTTSFSLRFLSSGKTFHRLKRLFCHKQTQLDYMHDIMAKYTMIPSNPITITTAFKSSLNRIISFYRWFHLLFPSFIHCDFRYCCWNTCRHQIHTGNFRKCLQSGDEIDYCWCWCRWFWYV